MSVFVDTGVFYAHHDRGPSRHEVGRAALREVLGSATCGHVLTSDTRPHTASGRDCTGLDGCATHGDESDALVRIAELSEFHWPETL